MAFRAPVSDIAFALKHGAGFTSGELGDDDIDAILAEAGRFASDVIAPLNAIGDKHGTPFKDGRITMPPGWKEAYQAWWQGGWNAVSAPAALGRPGAAARAQRRLHRDVEFAPRWRSASARC